MEIRDSIYRGREDFVYRVSIGEQPFITQLFPLGGQAGVATTAAIGGWNLPERQLTLDTEPGGAGIRQTAWRSDEAVSNNILYAVDSLPECREIEPNACRANRAAGHPADHRQRPHRAQRRGGRLPVPGPRRR